MGSVTKPVKRRPQRVVLLDEMSESVVAVDALRRLLGFELVHARSVPELMRRFADGRPDIVLVDVGLAERTRAKLLEFLSSVYTEVPVVALVDDRQAALASVKAGARATVPKPLEERVLTRLFYGEPQNSPVHLSRS